MTRLLAAHRPTPIGLLLLALAAVAVLVAGFEHARLWHRGYAEVEVVGPLFLLNAIGSTVVVLCLVFDRVALFALGSLAICVGSIVSILLSHNVSFFHFREGGYDTTAKVILYAEVVGAVLTLAGAALGGLRLRHAGHERVTAVTA
jgi:hypothetical protein